MIKLRGGISFMEIYLIFVPTFVIRHFTQKKKQPLCETFVIYWKYNVNT